MNCLDETFLEQVILKAKTLNVAEQEHLFQCYRCRECFLNLSKIYGNYTAADFELFFNKSKKLAGDNDANHTVILHPIQAKVPLKESPYRLAAMGKPLETNFTIYSFSNENEDIIGRILLDRQTHVLSVFLISANMEKVAGKKIILEDTKLEGITDNEGMISFGPQPNFNCSNVRFQSPLAVFNLSPHIVKPASIIQTHNVVLKNSEHDEIFIEIEKSNIHTSYQISIKKIKGEAGKKELQIIALTDKERTLSQITNKGLSVFETEGTERILKIHIF